MGRPMVGVVILAHGEEPLLVEAVDAVLASTGVDVDLVVVDNGYTGPDGDAVRSRRLRWLAPGRNTGFAAGSNLGAAHTRGERVAFVNSDAVVAPDALAEMVAALTDPTVGIATGQVLLYDEPGIVNSAGNPVHYSLLSWAGGWGDAPELHADASDVASASGCLLMLRRSVFEELDGFSEMLFAYGEDLELSLRAWQAGYRVRYLPTARVWHRYEFARTPGKYALLERNRWINLLTLYEGRTLLRLAPGLAVVEAGVWATALRGGWWPEKVRAAGAVVRERRRVGQRRRWVQERRRVPDAGVVAGLEGRIAPSERSGERVPEVVNRVVAGLRGCSGPAEEGHTLKPPMHHPAAADRRSPPDCLDPLG